MSEIATIDMDECKEILLEYAEVGSEINSAYAIQIIKRLEPSSSDLDELRRYAAMGMVAAARYTTPQAVASFKSIADYLAKKVGKV